MASSRNAPCPCGSGRKYKRCCLRADLEQGRDLALVRETPDAASGRRTDPAVQPFQQRTLGEHDSAPLTARAGEWQVDLVPLPGTWDLPRRLVMGLVVDASGFILSGDVIDPAPSETDDVVRAISSLLDSTARKVGVRPSLVRVRHPAVRSALAAELSGSGTQIRTARKLPRLDEVRRRFADDVLRLDDPDLIAVSTVAWSSWGIAADEIARLFSAAADFWSAKPWRILPGDEAISVVVPGVSRWNLLTLGAAEQIFGVALLESSADVPRMLDAALSGRSGLVAMHSMSLALIFGKSKELPPPVVEDVKRNKWPLPAREILPMLHAINTPAGGVSRRQIADLTAILRGTANFVRALEAGAIDPWELGFWNDASSDVNFIFDPAAFRTHAGTRVPSTLATAGAEGPGADPAARIDVDALEAALDAEKRQLLYLERWLRDTSTKDGESVNRRSGEGGVDRISNDVQNAQLFVEFLVNYQGVPVRAVSEYDLRAFLHDWIHRKVVMPDELAFGIPASIGRLFEFLAARSHDRIICPWAPPLLADEAMFRHRRETFPGRLVAGERYQEWHEEAMEALWARVLVPEPIASDADSVGNLVGSSEADLLDSLQRQWLIWRDDLIRQGTTERAAVVKALLARKTHWERLPNPLAAGRTPSDVVRAERRRLRLALSHAAQGEVSARPRRREK